MRELPPEGFCSEMICAIRNKGFPVPEDVLTAMTRVPRHLYAGETDLARAYGDWPLPIGDGQTISQPFMVAWMTSLLGALPGKRVLEVGTGSGYQAAVLAELGAEVYTIERKEKLYLSRGAFLGERYSGLVHTRLGDGSPGWPEHAPYDGIVVTAGGPVIPKPLQKQLARGGRLVMPVGGDVVQYLMLVTKGVDGVLRTEKGIGCRFVPLVMGV